MEQIKLYGKFEYKSEHSITLVSPSGKVTILEPFEYQPIEFYYDDEGGERVTAVQSPYKLVRFFPDELGVYSFDGGEFECVESDLHGYVEVSKKDPRYFAYSDSTSFCPIGINLAFITPYSKSNGDEFGCSGFKYLGMRQYESWFRECSKNGVNIVRIWIGHEYFSPDTEEAGVLDNIKLSKIEYLVELSKKYDIKLKLTLEQFRFFDYEIVADSDSYSDDVFRKFNKRLYIGDRCCKSAAEWLRDDVWREKWLYKVKELAKRFSGDPTVFGIELWNEMNCLPWNEMLEWNRYMLPKVKELFKRHLVMNSLGSFDCDGVYELYKNFVWELSDIKQVHRYLDQGSGYEICHDDTIALIRDAVVRLAEPNKPFIVAETGAVNNCHSGPFRYYNADHNGMIFCDLIYTPIFCCAAGCGHIWHWDGRYVESKNLYKYFKPIEILSRGIEFDREEFRSFVYEDDEFILLILRGKNSVLGYLRNKSYNWKNILRDLKDESIISKKVIYIPLYEQLEVINIWDDETAELSTEHDMLFVNNLKYGVLFKSTKGESK